ncbi:MAG: outer membrane beta-barrel protein [Cyclobacteriaceae bacterium]|nr:outer membrane beta-barrel protein [Cyclobacteriaceae bacterium]
MKIVLCIIVALVIFNGIANAQISQGTIAVSTGTNLNYSSSSYKGSDTKLNQFNLNLTGGYFFAQNFIIGAGIAYSSTNYKSSSYDYDTKSTTFSIFSRYYINGAFFLGIGYGSVKYEDLDALNELDFQVGYAAFISDNISIEPSLNYGLGLGDNEGNTFLVNLGFGLYLNR